MAGNVHAFLLILVVAASLTVCIVSQRLGRASPTPPPLIAARVMHVVNAALLAAMAMFFTAAVSLHRCDRGAPFAQWAVPGLCLFVTLIAVRQVGLRRLVAAALVVTMLGLSCHYSELVHDVRYTGNPLPTSDQCRPVLDELAHALRLAGRDDRTSYPAGWLGEVVPGAAPRRRGGYYATPFWHSALTGIYDSDPFQRTATTIDVWFPGGRLLEAADRLEFRVRETGRMELPHPDRPPWSPAARRAGGGR